MADAAPEYHLVTRWRLPATPEEVWAILEDPLSLPRWWPSVYLAAEEVSRGDVHGVGRLVNLRTKAWLPYTLRCTLRVTEVDPPRHLALEAYGDLEGTARWTFTPAGDHVEVAYDWRVRAEKLLLRSLTSALRPVFEADHRWAMDRGEESLRLEILRRRASSPEALAAIPPAPGPTPESSLSLLLGTVGTLGAVAGAAALLLRRRRPPA